MQGHPMPERNLAIETQMHRQRLDQILHVEAGSGAEHFHTQNTPLM